jgi:hypothetical protein
MGRKAGGFRKVKRADGSVVEVKPPTDNGAKKERAKPAATGRRASRAR